MNLKDKTYNLLDFIKIPLSVTPLFTTIRIVDKIIYALIPSLQILATASFVDMAIKIFKNEADRNQIYLPLVFILLIVTYQYVGYALMKFVTDKMNMKLAETFRVAVTEKRAKLKYEHVENNKTWELINRIGKDPAKRISDAFTILIRMADIIIRVVSILMILIVQVWWAAIVILAFSIPLLYIAIKSGKITYEASKEASKYQRRADYLHSILTGRENVEERALFSYTDNINEKWYEKFETARKINLKAELKSHIRMKGSSLITVLISVLIVGVLINPLITGAITLGMFTSLVTATFNLVQMMSWELTYITSEMANNYEYLKDLSTFSSLSETENALDIPDMNIQTMEPKCIEFIDVTFRYPGTETDILKNLSMKLYSGKHYAFVGVNGAGKTTITKLLTGMYEDFQGDILIDGRSIHKFTLSELKGLFSVVYQDFGKYYISMKDNIALGRISGISNEEIVQAAEMIGLAETIEKLPQGIDTFLGKIKEDSVDISGGQWQRIAIARTIVNKAPVHILDEPTAALDPVAESNIYEMFGKISKGKWAIFITHRLGAAKLADEILVIDDGKVCERGSHSELMEKSGIYADMFEAQRSWYL